MWEHVSPLIRVLAVWRNSAAGRGRSGYRPYCEAAPSALLPGCSLWTQSLTQSRNTRRMQVNTVFLNMPVHNVNCLSYLYNDFQCIKNNQVGLSCKVSINKCFMFQLCSCPTVRNQHICYKFNSKCKFIMCLSLIRSLPLISLNSKKTS